MSSSYNPSPQVEIGHQIPHLNLQFQLQNSPFSFTTEYLLSLLPFPLTILSICILLVLGYLVFLFCSCLCSCCCRRNRPDLKSLTYHSDLEKSIRSHEFTVRGFIFVLFALFSTNCLVWLGDAEASTAIDQFESGVQNTANLFNGVTNSANSISSDTDNIYTISNSAACMLPSGDSFYSVISTDLQVISAATNQISSLSSSVSDSVQGFSDTIGNTDMSIKDEVIGIYFSFIVVIIFCFIFALFFKKKFIFKISVGLSWFVVTALFIIASLLMVVVMFLADFCMDPAGNILSAAPSSIYEVLSFFITCSGTNPFSAPSDSLSTYTNDILTSVVNDFATTSECYTSITAQVNDVFTQINAIDNAVTTCTFLNGQFNDFINQALCTGGYKSLFDSWIVQFVLAFFLFLTMCFANAVYNSDVFIDTGGGDGGGNDGNGFGYAPVLALADDNDRGEYLLGDSAASNEKEGKVVANIRWY